MKKLEVCGHKKKRSRILQLLYGRILLQIGICGRRKTKSETDPCIRLEDFSHSYYLLYYMSNDIGNIEAFRNHIYVIALL